MSSWIAPPSYPPGHYVDASDLNLILDNITVLSTHDHSGSAGDGSATLSPNAIVSSSGILYPYEYVHSNSIQYFPASNGGWGTINPSRGFGLNGSQRLIANFGNIETDSDAASGASIAYAFYYNASVVGISVYMLTGPSAAIVSGSLNGVPVASGDGYTAAVGAIFAMGGTITNPSRTSSSMLIKLKTTGKNASSAAYGACIYGINIAIS